MMKKSKRIWLLACVLGAMGNGIVSAEEAAPVYMLDTVNVTAQAYEKKRIGYACRCYRCYQAGITGFRSEKYSTGIKI